mmetsp:Transcript_91775/g.262417  ORF Transcript_91775/g.262417 Transcript_91775/m.262417 type:complete len:280 (+) Transcript_91775:91-930(+)
MPEPVFPALSLPCGVWMEDSGRAAVDGSLEFPGCCPRLDPPDACLATEGAESDLPARAPPPLAPSPASASLELWLRVDSPLSPRPRLNACSRGFSITTADAVRSRIKPSPSPMCPRSTEAPAFDGEAVSSIVTTPPEPSPVGQFVAPSPSARPAMPLSLVRAGAATVRRRKRLFKLLLGSSESVPRRSSGADSVPAYTLLMASTCSFCNRSASPLRSSDRCVSTKTTRTRARFASSRATEMTVPCKLEVMSASSRSMKSTKSRTCQCSTYANAFMNGLR